MTETQVVTRPVDGRQAQRSMLHDSATVGCADVGETVAGQSVLVESHAFKLNLSRPTTGDHTIFILRQLFTASDVNEVLKMSQKIPLPISRCVAGKNIAGKFGKKCQRIDAIITHSCLDDCRRGNGSTVTIVHYMIFCCHYANTEVVIITIDCCTTAVAVLIPFCFLVLCNHFTVIKDPLHERHLNLSDTEDHFASRITSSLTSFYMRFTN